MYPSTHTITQILMPQPNDPYPALGFYQQLLPSNIRYNLLIMVIYCLSVISIKTL